MKYPYLLFVFPMKIVIFAFVLDITILYVFQRLISLMMLSSIFLFVGWIRWVSFQYFTNWPCNKGANCKNICHQTSSILWILVKNQNNQNDHPCITIYFRKSWVIKLRVSISSTFVTIKKLKGKAYNPPEYALWAVGDIQNMG